MNKNLKIIEIEKYEKQKNDNVMSIVNNAKLLSLFGVLIFVCAQDGLQNEAEELIIMGGSILGTANLILLIKSICKIYKINLKIGKINDENRKK